MTRPSWDEYFMEIATVASKRSTCIRRQVGAVLVKNNQILATGYNGVPTGITHCSEVGCLRERLGVPSGQKHELCRGLHAEQNTIIQAAINGAGVAGATIYTTHKPCSICMKILINAEVKRVVYCGNYHDPLTDELLAETDIEMVKF